MGIFEFDCLATRRLGNQRPVSSVWPNYLSGCYLPFRFILEPSPRFTSGRGRNQECWQPSERKQYRAQEICLSIDGKLRTFNCTPDQVGYGAIFQTDSSYFNSRTLVHLRALVPISF